MYLFTKSLWNLLSKYLLVKSQQDIIYESKKSTYSPIIACFKKSSQTYHQSSRWIECQKKERSPRAQRINEL